MKTACVILAAAVVLAFGQTTTKKATAADTKPNTWQRSKECAAQTEKVMRDKPGAWENHYSPKYDRCFISVIDGRTGSLHKLARKRLMDAFERIILATMILGGGSSVDDPDWTCQIDSELVDCLKADRFISDHMKN
jgi:hypothetical protein